MVAVLNETGFPLSFCRLQGNLVLHTKARSGVIMKIPAVILILISILLAAGCVSPASSPATPGATTPSIPVSVSSLTQDKPLPMDAHVTHTTPNTTFEVWIDSFEVGSVQENGDQELTIYVAAKNTGNQPIRMVWFCKLTDVNGKTYGGIGVSHGGNGARTDLIKPNWTEAARDYVNIRSDRDLAALKQGAVLDVYFMEKPSEDVALSLEPDYHTRWTINPGAIR